MPDNTRTYHNVSQEQYHNLIGAISDSGATVNGKQIISHGVTANYSYSDGSLTITIVKKSFLSHLTPNSEIFSILEEFSGLTEDPAVVAPNGSTTVSQPAVIPAADTKPTVVDSKVNTSNAPAPVPATDPKPALK